MRKLITILVLCGSAWAVDPPDCQQANVQSAITNTASGGTVNVPNGTCTWTTGISISGKNLTLKGAGIGVTTINFTGSGNVFTASVSAAHFVDISGFTWSTNGSISEFWSIDGENSAAWFQKGFRLHHNRFVIGGTIPHIGNPTGTFGLIDNNIFDVTGGAQSISPTGTPDGSDGGFTSWQQTGLNMGGDNAIFIEDNQFNYSVAAASSDDSIDAYGGARVVIRHNTFTNTHVGFHGYDSGNRRAPMWIEVYQNTFLNNTPSTKYRFCTFRGGTGVIWGNSTGGTNSSWDGCVLMVYRASPGTGAPGGWGNCNGTSYILTSNNFSSNGSRNATTSTGVFDSTHVGACSLKKEFLCTGDASCTGISGGTCQAWSDGSGNAGYPCRDQPGTGQGQVRDPIYFWSNSGPGNSIGTYDGGAPANGGGIQNYLLSGRDYINNGTTPKPGYTAFTYPHPLQGAGGSPSVQFSPTSSTFATTTVGQTAGPLVITITNVGVASLTITSLGISGDYSIQSNTCGTLPASFNQGEFCTANVVFTPTQLGNRTGLFTVTDNAPGSPQSVSLSGTGQAPTAPAVGLFAKLGGK